MDFTFDGGSGNANVNTSGVDTQFDTINGGSGNDNFFIDLDSAAVVNAGTGNDTCGFSTDNLQCTFTGGSGDDTVIPYVPREGQGTLNGTLILAADGVLHPGDVDLIGTDVDNIEMQNQNYGGDLEIIGNNAGDVLQGSTDGNLTIIGGSGNDTLLGQGEDGTVLDGGAGNDLLDGSATNGVLYLNGGAGNDTLGGSSNISPIFDPFGITTYYSGGPGNDTVDFSADTGNDVINLNPGMAGTAGAGLSSTVYFDGTVETVLGGSGNDVIVGTPGNNVLQGNGGNDTLIGDGGTDALFGGAGTNSINATGGTADYIDAGGGGTVYAGSGDTVVNATTVDPGSAKLTGTLLATAGSYGNDGNTAAKAVDGNLSTFFDGPTANGDYVGYDLGSARTIGSISFAPRSGFTSRMVGGVFQGSNSASFSSPTTLFTITLVPNAGQLTTVTPTTTAAFRYVRYVSPAGGYGNIAELNFYGSAPALPTGTVSVHLFNDTNGNGTQDSGEGNLAGFGTYLDLNGDGVYDDSDIRVIANASGICTFSNLPIGEYVLRQNVPAGYAVTTPTSGFPIGVNVTAGAVTTVLVGEKPGAALTGTPIGTAGSYANSGNTIAKAFDGNLVTYFDAPTASGNWVGLDLGTAQLATEVQFAPRPSFESRMIGGEFQASDTADFSSDVVTLATITATPAPGVLTTLSLNNLNTYRYYRYIGPAGSFCDIAELQFDG
jgi:hypothetical protein